MKKQFIHPMYSLLCLLAVMQGCSAGSDAPAGITDAPSELAIRASGSLFVAEDGTAPATRTTDSGYGTTFAPGDAIGVFVLKSDGNTLVVDNQEVKLQAGGNTWLPAVKYSAGATLYAYYPYRSDMNGKENIAQIVSALGNPDIDQSTPARYAAQDALTATGTVNTSAQTVSFQFQHVRTLIEITFPAGSSEVSFTAITPLSVGGSVYRYLATPGSSFSLSAAYVANGNSYLAGAPVTAPAAGGKYKKVTVRNP